MSRAHSYKYQTGFGNEFATESEAGALPIGRNSPQRAPLGLYTEKFSGTAFTAPKANNRRSWFYRIRPSVTTVGFSPADNARIQTAPIAGDTVSPDPLRWHPFEIPATRTDFVDGLFTMAACGDASAQTGAGIHVYCANESMVDRFYCDADGELLLVPQSGALVVHSEFGVVEVPAGSIGVIPRGIKFRIELPQGPSRGYVCENYGAIFELPERGPIGSDSLANARDFEAPIASYEDRDGDFELVCKLGGRLFSASIDHSPLDVVAWHGNLYPYRYDLDRFNVIGSTSFDHPDPSIYTVLTSQSDTAGTANVDFVIFPPRWLVMEDTFRPPWYHRNVMSEFMGLIRGQYDGKTSGGFTPGASSLHNSMVPHGPDQDAFDSASMKELAPEAPKDTMAFMFESRYLIRPTQSALDAPERQHDYPQVWQGLGRHFKA